MSRASRSNRRALGIGGTKRRRQHFDGDRLIEARNSRVHLAHTARADEGANLADAPRRAG